MKGIRLGLIGAALAVATICRYSARADVGPVLAPCLRASSTLCPVVGAVFDFEEDNDRSRFDSVTGALAQEPDGYSVARRAGKIGSYAADFAGSDNSWLRLPAARSLGPGNWTVTAWVYPDTVGSAGQKQTLLANDFKNQAGTHVYLENVSGSLYLKVSVTTAELDTTIVATSPNALTVSAWNFVAFGASPFPSIDGQAIIFAQVNNSTKGTAALTYFPRAMNTQTYVGARVSQTAGSRTPFDGGIDQLAFFGDALNPMQVQNLYYGGTGRAYPFVDPSYTSTVTLALTATAGAQNLWAAGTCSDLTSNDSISTIVSAAEYNGSGNISCEVADPAAGGVYNWVKVHAYFAGQGTGSFNLTYGFPTCGSEALSYGYALLRTNGTDYTSGALAMTQGYWNGDWNNPCGYGAGYMVVTGTWNTNPNTGLAWSYNDIVNLQAGASTAVGNPANGAYTLYSTATYVYVEVNVTYN